MTIKSDGEIENAARLMRSMGARNVLIKGGHRQFDGSANRIARDFLFTPDGARHFDSAFIDTDSTHGTGCTLAAGITANLALGRHLEEAVEISKRFVTAAIENAPELGRGHSPVNHLIKEW
jgi:hydroxymethylpyrimidine kinase/phosphomethylpyrimidine kinase